MKIKIVDLCKINKKLTERQIHDLIVGFDVHLNLEKFFNHTTGKLRKKSIKHLYVIEHMMLPHKTNSPAIVMNDGSELWMRYGTLHRENGKAISGSFIIDDYKDEEYFLHGRCFEIKEYLKILGKESMMNFL